MLTDPTAEHQMQVKMLGNSGVYVTCNCIVKQHISTLRSPTVSRTRVRRRLADYASLGDFPVGAPLQDMLTAYNRHLEAS